MLPIFPIDLQTRPAVDMCRAAISAARNAFGSAAALSGQNPEDEGCSFGLSLHLGQIMYGNLGTERRLDFTVMGPEVNQVTRLEGLCKTMGVPIVMSEGFQAQFKGNTAPLGQHTLPGLDHDIAVYPLPEFDTL